MDEWRERESQEDLLLSVQFDNDESYKKIYISNDLHVLFVNFLAILSELDFES